MVVTDDRSFLSEEKKICVCMLWHFQVVSHIGMAHLFNEPLMVALIKAG